MRIKIIIRQYRRDFWADYECEHCGYIEKNQAGYDDAYFHNEVIPKMVCKNCGKSAPADYTPLVPRYPENMQV